MFKQFVPPTKSRSFASALQFSTDDISHNKLKILRIIDIQKYGTLHHNKFFVSSGNRLLFSFCTYHTRQLKLSFRSTRVQHWQSPCLSVCHSFALFQPHITPIWSKSENTSHKSKFRGVCTQPGRNTVEKHFEMELDEVLGRFCFLNVNFTCTPVSALVKFPDLWTSSHSKYRLTHK